MNPPLGPKKFKSKLNLFTSVAFGAAVRNFPQAGLIQQGMLIFKPLVFDKFLRTMTLPTPLIPVNAHQKFFRVILLVIC